MIIILLTLGIGIWTILYKKKKPKKHEIIIKFISKKIVYSSYDA